MKLLKIIFFITLVFSNAFAKNNYFNEGLAYYEKKELNKAKFKFEQDIVFNPKNEKSYLYLSKIFNTQKEKELEEKNLNTVILLNPENEEESSEETKDESVPASTLKTAVSTTENVSDAFDDLFNS